MKNRLVYYFLIVVIVIAAATGLLASAKRLSAEAKNSAVELVMDLADIKKIALRDGHPVDWVLKEVKDAGITSIALTEDTLETLELEGRLAWLTGYEQNTLLKISKVPKNAVKKLSPRAKVFNDNLLRTAKRISKAEPAYSYVVCDDRMLLARIEAELSNLLGKDRANLIYPDSLEIRDDEEDLLNLGLGVSPVRFEMLVKKGFFIVPRLRNNYRYDENKVMGKLLSLRLAGPFTTVIFDGEEVLGYKNNIRGVAKAFKEAGLNYGYIEMAEQKGDSELLKTVGTFITRVHSISEDEMLKKMTKTEALERFDRAVAERGARMLFIRPFYMPEKGKDLTATNASYVSELKSRIAKAGHPAGLADSPEKLEVKVGAVSILSMGIAAGFILMVAAFWEIPAWLALVTVLLAGVAPFAAGAGGLLLFYRKLAALGAAVVFPVLALTSVFKKDTKDKLLFMSIARSILMVLGAFAISMAGALLVIGLLSDTLFMLGAQQFAGIKIAFALPVLLTAAYCAFMESDEIKSFWGRLTEWINSPITGLTVLVGAVILGSAALYLLRSGNFGIGVLDTEKLARAFLENIMIVRPRTKEFLIGYPALFLGAMYYLGGGRKWLWPFLLIGVVATVSTVNTFCHIHSPLLISLLRAMYGVILGITFGILYFTVYAFGRRIFRL